MARLGIAASGIRRAGDAAWNARRRYTRQAERYLKQAQNAKGIEKGRLETEATASLERAIATYKDPTQASKSSVIQKLTDKLHPNVPTRKVGEGIRNQYIAESYAALESTRNDESIRRELEAEEILSTDIGNRIYGALVDVWKDDDYEKRNQNIMEHFGVDSMADVLDILEASGIDIYADPESLEKYDEVRTAISEKFA